MARRADPELGHLRLNDDSRGIAGLPAALYASRPAVDVATIIDAAASSRVLVVGSLPPAGRDYDLLAREVDRGAIAAALRARGFESVQRGWVRFKPDGPEIVELITPADWGLPDHEAEAVFEQALLLDGHAHLCVPAPAHELLILARKLPRTPGFLEPKSTASAFKTRSCARPTLGVQARARARDWSVETRLRRLQARCARAPRAGWPPRYLRRPRRGAVVALSGLDGVGKSTQAETLRASLTKLGYEAVVVWVPIGNSPLYGASRGRQAITCPSAGRTARPRRSRDRRAAPALPDRGRRPSRRALAQGCRGALVDCDYARQRFVLPPVRARHSHRRPDRDLRPLRSGHHRPAPLRVHAGGTPPAAGGAGPSARARAALAFLLDAAPETAYARKPDWSLAQTRMRAQLYRRACGSLGVRLLDAERTADELAAQIAREVLETISS